MAATELEVPSKEILANTELGEMAFNFTEMAASRIADTPQFQRAVVGDFFDRRMSDNPRYYGTNFTIDNALWHVSFKGEAAFYNRVYGSVSLSVTIYDVAKLKEDPKNPVELARFHSGSYFGENEDIKNFRDGHISYSDSEGSESDPEKSSQKITVWLETLPSSSIRL